MECFEPGELRAENKVVCQDFSKIPLEKIELNLHNIYKMAAVSVMDEEIELMKRKISSAKKEDASMFEEKLGRIEFRREMIVGNIELGLVSQEQYIHDLEVELRYEEKLLALIRAPQSNSENSSRVARRIELIKQELKEIQDSSEGNETLANPPLPENKSEAKPTSEIVVDKNVIPITDKDLIKHNSTKSVEVKEEKETIERTASLSEYSKAIGYLKEIGKLDRAEELSKTIQKIDPIPPLSPEILFGYSVELRISKYREVINFLEEFIEKNLQTLEKAKMTARQSQFPKAVETLRASVELLTQKNKEAETCLNDAKAALLNIWQPIPDYHFETFTTQREVINEEIQPKEILLSYNPTTLLNGQIEYKISYILSCKTELAKGYFSSNHKANIQIACTKSNKKIEKGQALIRIELISWFAFGERNISKIVKFDSFAMKNTISVVVSLNNNHFLITFQIRQSTRAPEMETLKHQQIIIDKISPAFKGNKLCGETIEEIKHDAYQKGCRIETKETLLLPIPLPEGIREIDVTDPDEEENLVCVTYLENKISAFTEQIKTWCMKGKKVPPEVSSKLKMMTKRHSHIMKKIQAEELKPEEYKSLLERQLKKNQTLFAYFLQSGMIRKIRIVEEQIECLEKEIRSFGE